MKLLSFVLCFFVAIQWTNAELSQKFKDEFLNQLEKIGEKCAAETGASASDITKIITKHIPESHEGKCLLFCGHREFKMQNADGSVNMAGAMEMLDKIKADDADLAEKLKEVFHYCSDPANVPVNSDPCLYASDLSTCGTHRADKLGIDSTLLE